MKRGRVPLRGCWKGLPLYMGYKWAHQEPFAYHLIRIAYVVEKGSNSNFQGVRLLYISRQDIVLLDYCLYMDLEGRGHGA